MNKDRDVGDKIIALNTRQEGLLTGLLESFDALQSIGLPALSLITRNNLETILKEEYHPFIGNSRKEELHDTYFQSVFSLVMSRQVNSKKPKV